MFVFKGIGLNTCTQVRIGMTQQRNDHVRKTTPNMCNFPQVNTDVSEPKYTPSSQNAAMAPNVFYTLP